MSARVIPMLLALQGWASGYTTTPSLAIHRTSKNGTIGCRSFSGLFDVSDTPHLSASLLEQQHTQVGHNIAFPLDILFAELLWIARF